MLAGIGSPGTLQEVRRYMPFASSTLLCTVGAGTSAPLCLASAIPFTFQCSLAGAPLALFADADCTPLQVIRGYIGDQSAEPIFEGTQLGRAFDTVGRGYQRPFELATLRLQNMVGILPKCALFSIKGLHGRNRRLACQRVWHVVIP